MKAKSRKSDQVADIAFDADQARIVGKTAREPKRRSGHERFRKLLRVLDELLSEKETQNVGIYEIAQRAAVPPASVYHFFPGKEAAFLALAAFHHRALEEISRTVPRHPPATWQQLCQQKVAETAAYFNDSPGAMRLFFGSNISFEVRAADVSQYSRLAEGRHCLLDRYFDVSAIPALERHLRTYFAVVDGVFSLAYCEDGMISDEYVAESHTAGTAYLRCYLPEQLPLRLDGSDDAT